MVWDFEIKKICFEKNFKSHLLYRLLVIRVLSIYLLKHEAQYKK